MSKTIEQTLLERRSIRRYTRDSISPADLEFVYAAIRNTPTSYNGQQFTVIDIDDPQLKVKLYELTGQKQIKTCSHFMVFCADYRKIELAAAAKGIETGGFPATADGYTVGVIDASLALMSALVAAESRGLGTCPIGYIRTVDPDAVVSLLGLPRGVMAVCGLAIGVPRELPDLKPKQPVDVVVRHNGYGDDSIVEQILGYDKEVTRYNRTREGTKSDNDWVAHIVGYYREGDEAYDILGAARKQGFLTADK